MEPIDLAGKVVKCKSPVGKWYFYIRVWTVIPDKHKNKTVAWGEEVTKMDGQWAETERYRSCNINKIEGIMSERITKRGYSVCKKIYQLKNKRKSSTPEKS